MAKREFPVTAAVRWLEARNISFIPRLYSWEEHGGTHHAAVMLNEDEHCIVKTLVMEGESVNQFLVLMHGDREVSTKNLAKILKVKKVVSCSPQVAEKKTGYQVGGISPFGIRHTLPIYVQKTILSLPKIFINGGKRGFLVEIGPSVLTEKIGAIPVEVVLE
jgi:Cys-tRNA(Pro) deacylase